MGVTILMAIGVSIFKSPDVITQLGAANDACVCHVGQIAEDGRFVETQWNKLVCNIRMSLWSMSGSQELQDRDACRSASQPGCSQDLSNLLNFIRI